MKRIICFPLCLTLMLALTACGNNPKPDSADLLHHLQFHGTEFSFPCTYGEISEQFGLDNEDDLFYDSYGYLYYDLTFQGESVAVVGFISDKMEQIESKEIEMLEITDDELSALKLGDTVCDANFKALTKALGKPNSQMEQGTSKIITYKWDGVELNIIFHDDQPHQYTFVKRS